MPSVALPSNTLDSWFIIDCAPAWQFYMLTVVPLFEDIYFFGHALEVPGLGIKPKPQQWKCQILNQWTPYCSIFNFIDSSQSSPFFYWTHVVILFQLLYFSVLKLPLCFLFEINFSFVLNVFVVAYWSIFMMAVLKSLPDNSNIWSISVLVSVVSFLIDDAIFLVLTLSEFQLYKGHFGDFKTLDPI